MRRTSTVWLLVGAAVVLLTFWIANHTYWADTKVPMPPKGEARVNRFYAAQRFAEALGSRTVRERVLTTPPADSVMLLSGWHWNLSRGRREMLERWVESGGRLVVDWSLAGGEEEFERWSGIVREYHELEDKDSAVAYSDDPCRTFREEHDGRTASGSDTAQYRICGTDTVSFLTTKRTPDWALRGASGIQATRVHVGRGSVTVINATPFRYRGLFEGDHGRLFVAATGLRRGDDVHFVSEDDHPSLLALTWRHGGPVVALLLGLIGLVLWRGSVRFGPLAAPAQGARRSLAEQIRGTGQFTLRCGGGESLHAASLRALHEAAERRIPGYARLSGEERAAALARLTGFDRSALAAAVRYPVSRSHELRSTIALIEAARRRTL